MKQKTVLVLGTLVLLLVGAGLAYYYLVQLSGHWLAALLLLAVLVGWPVLFLVGWWMGKTEVRGFLSGFDRSLDRMTQVVDTRDSKRAATSTPTPPPNILVLPSQPGLPRITHRTQQQDVNDL